MPEYYDEKSITGLALVKAPDTSELNQSQHELDVVGARVRALEILVARATSENTGVQAAWNRLEFLEAKRQILWDHAYSRWQSMDDRPQFGEWSEHAKEWEQRINALSNLKKTIDEEKSKRLLSARASRLRQEDDEQQNGWGVLSSLHSSPLSNQNASQPNTPPESLRTVALTPRSVNFPLPSPSQTTTHGLRIPARLGLFADIGGHMEAWAERGLAFGALSGLIAGSILGAPTGPGAVLTACLLALISGPVGYLMGGLVGFFIGLYEHSQQLTVTPTETPNALIPTP